MAYLQAWMSTVPLLVALLVVLYLPGLLVLRAADVRRNLSIGVAPAVTCGLVGVGGIVLDLLGVPWNLGSFLATTLAACGLVLGYRAVLRRSGRDHLPIGGEIATTRWTARQRLVVIAALVVAVLFHWVPILIAVDPYFPSALSDPMFHYNGINAVMNTGNASIFGAMDWNYGLRVLDVIYPSVWHALAALVAPSTGVVGVAHVLSYLVTPVIFLVGMACLGAEVFPLRRLMTALTPLVAAGFVAFPDYMTVGKGFWPNALALALFPGLLALAVAVVLDIARGRLDRNAVRYGGSIMILLAGTAGLVLAHPTFVFTPLWVGAPAILVLLVRLLQRLWQVWPRGRVLALSVVSASVLAALLVAVGMHPQVQAALSRPVSGEWEDLVARLSSTIMLWPASRDVLVLLALATFYGSVTLLGALVAARDHRARWALAAWIMQTLLILGTYFPLPLLSSISGIWYSDVYRLFAVQVVFLPLLMSIALGALWSGLRTGEMDGGTAVDRPWIPAPLHRLAGRGPARAGVAVFVIIHLALGAYLSQFSAYAPAAPSIGEREIIGSEEELELLRDLDDLVPEGSVILGDSLSGVGYAPAVSDANSVFTQVSVRSLDLDGNYLTENFANIHEDPTVCSLIRHYGITHYYQDDPLQYEGEQRQLELPGLYDVDTSTGFTEVASAGDATLWSIDVCGEVEPRTDWWDEEWRADAVVDGDTG
ncbi:hypothetical protein CFK38_08455 [Brachybacterium vulturis]|uniref:Uncharacterized protein n=1 Tax=Brachybacterium vulturis TaxID=2017484 RepID=A0A291GNC5_9MICO|nr:DUF6541 family protein [Brachybacterium vulturis]ATG51552.1 hypothetical protein CFK38_08455 [Brachybacterium vulturis]